MRIWKRILLIPAISFIGIVVSIFVLAYFFSDFLVNFWWFNSLGYEQYFWYRLLYQYGIFVAVTLVFFVIFFLNFWVGSKFLGVLPPSEPNPLTGARRHYRTLYERFQKRSLAFYLPLSLFLAVLIAIPLFYQWENALLYFAAPNAGIQDQIYGKDISYYMFSLPIYLLLFRELLFAFLIVLFGLTLLYWLESRVIPGHDRNLCPGAKIHLNIVMLCIVLIGAWNFILERHQLLYTSNHMPVFYGPGYVEMHITLPFIWACLILLLAVAAFFIYFVNTRKGFVEFVAVTVLFLFILGARYSPVTADVLQTYFVVPNEIEVESPYIANHIQATLASYKLQDVETREYPAQETLLNAQPPNLRMFLKNIPIWDEVRLYEVYRELQEIRTYYSFNNVAVDRYTVDGIRQQITLSPREINLKELPEGARNWVNQWLKYTHGYGIVMTPSAQDVVGPMQWFMQGIPPRSDYGLHIEEPGIYYGTGGYSPVIAPNDSHEIDYSSDDTVELTDYKGSGGVGISTFFKKLIFAAHFKEKNIFFTNQTNKDSRILFNRNIADRISTLTPFLLLDPKPYAVVTPERIYWIQDAYTFSSRYPYARPYDGRLNDYGRSFNYIRNSVKIVVDAYNGSVNYYVVDPDDLIVQAYTRIYPGLFKRFDQMPDNLKAHVRYPKSLFDVQMEIYGRYQQVNPESFYKQEDMWVFPEIQLHNDMQAITSYYLMLNLIESSQFEFSLFAPMNPKGKNNLRALAVVGCDGKNYGRIITYNFPKGTLVYGPPQVNALIKQDAMIAQQFTLWDQRGSEVDRGRMVIIPLDGVITYIQGVFMSARTGVSIPELVALIVNQGDKVVMAQSLEEGFEALNKRIQDAKEQPARTQVLDRPAELPDVVPSGD